MDFVMKDLHQPAEDIPVAKSGSSREARLQQLHVSRSNLQWA